MRFYHVDIARFAANTDQKWMDNLLSHFDIPGVFGGRQGVPRRIAAEGIYHIALVRRLHRALGLSVSDAVSLARTLLSTDAGQFSLGDQLTLHFDFAGFRRSIDAAIADGVESVVPARRGRPRVSRRAEPASGGS